MKLSLIIVHYNTPLLLKNQLSNLAVNDKIEIIVVDNNSSQSIKDIQSKFPQVTFIENTINYGYAFACNQGAATARGEWLLFLNPDVGITTKQVLEFVKSAENNKLDAASPDILDPHYQKPYPSFLSLIIEFTPLNKISFLLSRGANLIHPGGEQKKTLFGGCLLIKKSVLFALGGWDERFFIWFEDSDLTKRLFDAKYSIGFIPSTITHSGGESFKNLDMVLKKDIFFNSLNIFAQKHFNLTQKVIIKLVTKHFSKKHLLPKIDETTQMIVPNMRRELLDTFLEKNLSHFNENTEVIIVSSSIQPDNFYEYKKKYPSVRFITLTQNKGFAKTVNIGFRASHGAYLGTVNDDTLFNSDWVGECLKNVKVEEWGSINPKIENREGEIESLGISVLPYGKAVPITDTQKELNIVDATNAAAVIYNKKALEQTGIFDERFGSYLEDIDLSLRLSRNNFKNMVCQTVSITHLKHQTTNTIKPSIKKWNDFKNWIFIILKNWTFKSFFRYFPQIVLERLRNLSGLLKNKVF